MILLDNINETTEVNQNENEKTNLEELQCKYDNIKKEVDDLESNKESLNESVNKMHNSFELINKNVEELMTKLDAMGMRVDESKEETNKRDRFDFSLNNMIVNPLRKVAVGTIRAAIMVGEKANEEVANIREGMEDVVAEAQYLNKKQRVESVDFEQN